MSHFLKRIAASVAENPAGPRLRPLSGSIYMPAQSTAPPNEPWEKATESPSDAIGEGAVQSKPISRAAQTKIHAQPTAYEESKANVLPLVARSPHTDPLPQPAGPSSRELPINPVSALARDGSASGSPERNNSEAQGGKSLRTQEQPEHLLPLRARDTVVWPATEAAHRNPAEPFRRVKAPVREPDEITIHIGRIEVAAVTQPPMRPAPATPARKAMSLDEYLRRGNGRAR